ncbi:esterase family protein [Terriglobus sp. RCC_193]|uniref:esterase family protein n=1 Tax=Terriglobus sp. RCC_193 TaxID=3239218 RepID=UPI0035234082
MHREYHVDQSEALGRSMEHLVFGQDGLPVIVFPTSRGRFYEFEDQAMVGALESKINRGQIQLWCVDSVNNESWFADGAEGSWCIARHLQYERYILNELVPYIHTRNRNKMLAVMGCSFGGFHSMSMALRHPDKINAALSMGGAFDVARFLHGYYCDDLYFTLPMDFLPNLHDHWYLDRYRHNTYILATGHHDQYWDDNERLATIMRDKNLPVRLDVWGDNTGHDWPWWRRMVQTYV